MHNNIDGNESEFAWERSCKELIKAAAAILSKKSKYNKTGFSFTLLGKNSNDDSLG